MNLMKLFGMYLCAAALCIGSNAMAWDGWTSTPNVCGGYNYSGSNGQSITSIPNVFGGFNYSGYNGMSGISMPNVLGGYNYNENLFCVRSQNAKSFFANEFFRGKIDEVVINLTIQLRYINALLSSAWDLRGFEIVTGLIDDKLTSEKMFNLAAQIAVEQNNVDALKSVISLPQNARSMKSS